MRVGKNWQTQSRSDEKVIPDQRYPRKYEDATEIVDLLAGKKVF